MFACGMLMIWPGLRLMASTIRGVALANALAMTITIVSGSGWAEALAQGRLAPAQDRALKFVSLKADRVDVRAGPGPTHKVAWVFQRAGLPVEILRESEGWREIRDAEGAVGWVQTRHLSLRRTVLVTGVATGTATASTTGGPGAAPGIAFKARASDDFDTLVLIEAGIVGNLVACDGTWCQVGLADVRGFLPQNQLWGVLQGEIVK